MNWVKPFCSLMAVMAVGHLFGKLFGLTEIGISCVVVGALMVAMWTDIIAARDIKK